MKMGKMMEGNPCLFNHQRYTDEHTNEPHSEFISHIVVHCKYGLFKNLFHSAG